MTGTQTRSQLTYFLDDTKEKEKTAKIVEKAQERWAKIKGHYIIVCQHPLTKVFVRDKKVKKKSTTNKKN